MDTNSYVMPSFVKLLVEDLSRAAAFYEGLGFQRLHQDAVFVHLRWHPEPPIAQGSCRHTFLPHDLACRRPPLRRPFASFRRRLYIFIEMSSSSQISAYVSESTRERLDRYAEAHGIKKAFLMEQAILHHLQALRELPTDIIVPARVVVSTESGKAVLKKMTRATKPSAALTKLLRED